MPATSNQHRPAPGNLRLVRYRVRDQILCMDTENARQLQVAVSHVHEAVNTLTLSGCDKDDMFELMERVDSELNSSHPNQQTVTMFLNSIARSLAQRAGST